jgi:hypothetical protein
MEHASALRLAPPNLREPYAAAHGSQRLPPLWQSIPGSRPRLGGEESRYKAEYQTARPSYSRSHKSYEDPRYNNIRSSIPEVRDHVPRHASQPHPERLYHEHPYEVPCNPNCMRWQPPPAHTIRSSPTIGPPSSHTYPSPPTIADHKFHNHHRRPSTTSHLPFTTSPLRPHESPNLVSDHVHRQHMVRETPIAPPRRPVLPSLSPPPTAYDRNPVAGPSGSTSRTRSRSGSGSPSRVRSRQSAHRAYEKKRRE